MKQLVGRVFLFVLFVAVPQGGANELPPFPAVDSNFESYRINAVAYLFDRAMSHRSRQEVLLNAPFELAANNSVPYRGKFLLLHGLNDSPYVWREFAYSLVEKGFDVRAILLPGHGTTPKDMLKVSYLSWLDTVREHFKIWNTDQTPMFVGGFSLGGILATVLALENSSIDGLLLVSPAFNSRLNHLLRWSWLYRKFRPWLYGGMILEDNPIKYNSIAINSGTQFYAATKYLKRHWRGRKLDMPVLVAVTEDDSVVDIEYVRKVFDNRFSSNKKRLIYYSAKGKESLKPHEIRRNSRLPDRRLLNQSHLSLINSPQNLLYGEDRKVLVCNGNEYPVFMACMGATSHWYGAQHTPSPDGIPVARTTYNPDYGFILKQFDQVFTDDSHLSD